MNKESCFFCGYIFSGAAVFVPVKWHTKAYTRWQVIGISCYPCSIRNATNITAAVQPEGAKPDASA